MTLYRLGISIASGEPMGKRYECHRCWKSSEHPDICCGAPMTRVLLDEGIFWPFMWLPEEGEIA